MAKKKVTLAEYLFRTVGFRKGTRVAAFIAAWGIYSDSVEDGQPVNLWGYTHYWKSSQATTYRELATFHEAFPDEALPDRLWANARLAVESRKSVPAAAAQLMTEAGTWP